MSSEVDGGPTGPVAPLQPERTALAWERTGIAIIVAGALAARQAAAAVHVAAGLVGVAQAGAGGLLVAWAARHHRLLHDQRLTPRVLPQVAMTRVVGLATVGFCALALAIGLVSLVV